MKVLILAQYFPPDMGGGSTRASNVAKGLLCKGCDVTIVAAFPHYPHGKVPRGYRGKAVVPERFGGAKVFRVWIPSLPHSSPLRRVVLHFCFVVSSLFALPFIGKVDVVWTANPNLFCFLPAVVYGVVKQVPIVRNVDDLWPEVFYELGYVKSRLARKVLDILAWLSYVVPAAVTPISRGYKRRIVEKYGVSARKVHVVEVGVDRVEPLNADRNSNERFVVMYSGVLGLGYDFDVVLEAASRLAEHEDIVFVIRGVGELAPSLQRRIRELSLKNVVLDIRFLPKEKLSALLGSADVFVVPMASASSVDEGLPTKIFEYQAYGKPIICVSEGEPANYVEETNSGIVVKPGDYEALAKAVVYLKENRDVGEKLGASGRRYVESNLSIEKIGMKMMAVFSDVLRGSSRVCEAENGVA